MKDLKEYPEISVIMSVFNEPEEWFRNSIESVINQSFSNIEFLIINDNPSRQLNNLILENYKALDKRIIVINNQINIGLTKSLNLGFENAKGKYIARMDADDICHPDRLLHQFIFLEKNPQISLLGSWVKTFGGKKKQIWRNPKSSSKLKTALFFGNRISHSSVMFRKDVFIKENLKYDLNFHKAQDYDLWYRASLKLNLANLNKFLLYYRVHENQISSESKSDQDIFADRTRLNFLNHLLPHATLKEKKLHLKSCKYQNLEYNEILELPNWLEKLKQRNISENLFNKKYFNQLLIRRAIFYSFTHKRLSLQMRLKLIFTVF